MFRQHPATKALALILALTMILPADLVLAASRTKVEHEPPGAYIPGFRINLAAEIEDKAGILLARCYFKTSKDEAYVFVDMTAGKKHYRATLPAPWLSAGDIEYLFVVVNGDKKVFRSESYRLPEKKTKQAKKWKELGEPREVRLDLVQEFAEKYAPLRDELVKEYRKRLPEWQEWVERVQVDVKTEIGKAKVRLQGFLDNVVVNEVPDYLRYGLLLDGLYPPAEVSAAGGTGAVATATGAAAGAAGGAAAAGGSSWVLWTLGGLAVAGGGAAAVLASNPGLLGGDEGTDVKDAQASDFVGNFDATDPGRPRSEYRAVFTFNAGGSGSITEFVSGISGSANLTWSFNEATDTFAFQVPGGGSASGLVSGTTNDFTLNGRYSNGTPAVLHLVRQ
jgi:hypothetical protein